MTSDNTNPFVLPGFGQSGDLGQNPLLASMEMMRQAWSSLADKGGLGAPSLASSLSLDELERRIADLRAVENWLRMNLTVLSSTIQGLEVQRSTIATLKSFVVSAASTQGPGQGQSPLEAVLGIRAAGSGSDAGGGAAASGAQDARAAPADAAATGMAQLFNSEKASEATQAWWGLLQDQFNSLAAATTATMQGAAAPAQTPAAPAKDKAPPAAKAAASKAASPKKTARPAARKTAQPRSPGRKKPA